MIGFQVSNKPFSNTEKRLKKLKNIDDRILAILNKHGKKAVESLSIKTPVLTGLTASSWYYKIEKTSSGYRLLFCNSNVQNGIPIAIILDTGHGTRNGGWVEGRNYINPTLTPFFDKIASDIRSEVSRL